jgi:hypothetical protein
MSGKRSAKQVGEWLRSKEGKYKKSMGVKGEDGDKAVYKVVFDKLRVSL